MAGRSLCIPLARSSSVLRCPKWVATWRQLHDGPTSPRVVWLRTGRPYYCHDAGLHCGRQVRPLFDHTLQIDVESGGDRFNCCASCSAIVRMCRCPGSIAGLQLTLNQ